jgi:hypothetical protein
MREQVFTEETCFFPSDLLVATVSLAKPGYQLREEGAVRGVLPEWGLLMRRPGDRQDENFPQVRNLREVFLT